MRVVIDTNILVSGLLTPFGDCATILNFIVTGSLDLCYDIRIMKEYEQVLKRPKFQFEKKAVSELLDFFRQYGIQVTPTPLPFTLPDPEDTPFVEVALASGSGFLITGNLKHYPAHCLQNVKISPPKQFLQFYTHNNPLD